MNVAVLWFQHSPIFGHCADSHTVCRSKRARQLLQIVVVVAHGRARFQPLRLGPAPGRRHFDLYELRAGCHRNFIVNDPSAADLIRSGSEELRRNEARKTRENRAVFRKFFIPDSSNQPENPNSNLRRQLSRCSATTYVIRRAQPCLSTLLTHFVPSQRSVPQSHRIPSQKSSILVAYETLIVSSIPLQQKDMYRNPRCRPNPY